MIIWLVKPGYFGSTVDGGKVKTGVGMTCYYSPEARRWCADGLMGVAWTGR